MATSLFALSRVRVTLRMAAKPGSRFKRPSTCPPVPLDFSSRQAVVGS